MYAADCNPALCPKILAIENDIEYMAIYSPWFPLAARFNEKALAKGKAIISPIVIKSIPTTKIPDQLVAFNTSKLKPVSTEPNKTSPIIEYLEFSNHLISGISNKKIRKPLQPKSTPTCNSLNSCTSR